MTTTPETPGVARIRAKAAELGWTVAPVHPTLQPDNLRITRGAVEVFVYLTPAGRIDEAARREHGDPVATVNRGPRLRAVLAWLDAEEIAPRVELSAELVAELQADARAAHTRSMVAAPALSAVVMREAEGLPVGSARFAKVATVWADAYQAAVDAEVARLFPSVIAPPADPSPEYAYRGDDALRIMGARGDDEALVELDRRRAAERAAWDRQYARGNKPAEPTGPTPGSFHDPRVDCCERDAADCDCTETCERCGATFDPEQAGTTDHHSGISLCTDCTAHNADRVTV